MKSPKVHEPLTKLQCCPTSDGWVAVIRSAFSRINATQNCSEFLMLICDVWCAHSAAAAILCSERFVYKYGLQKQAVEVVGMTMVYAHTEVSVDGDHGSLMHRVRARRPPTLTPPSRSPA